MGEREGRKDRGRQREKEREKVDSTGNLPQFGQCQATKVMSLEMVLGKDVQNEF